ncbi:MAG: PEP-CTERM sorting domain-containing protein [Isosphaeraceae bacterium]
MVNRFVLARLPRVSLGALVTMAVLTVGAQNTHAQSNWNGGTGDWNVPGNWTPTGVPNSASTDVFITSGTPSSVALDTTLDILSPTIRNLSLDSFSTLTMVGVNLNVAGSTISNNGAVLIGGSSGNADLYVDASTVTLSGAGTVSLNNADSYLEGSSSSNTLVNTSTIQGQGYIYGMNLNNQGTVNANVSGGTLSISSAQTKNSGTFQVNEGSTLQVSDSFTTTGTVNIGAVSDRSGSLFQVLGSNDYVQTSGTTSLWSAHSTLAVAAGQSVNIEGGLLQGFGTVQGNLINSGTVHPGDGPGILTVTGNYTQNASGILDIVIGGRTPGSGYSVLSVTGSALLGGMLDVSLVNGFSPVTDDTFVILTSGGLSGVFTDNTIQVGNVTFDVEYSPTGYKNDVVLMVAQVSAVPEPASWLMLGLGLAAVGTCVVRKSKSQVRGK